MTPVEKALTEHALNEAKRLRDGPPLDWIVWPPCEQQHDDNAELVVGKTRASHLGSAQTVGAQNGFCGSSGTSMTMTPPSRKRFMEMLGRATSLGERSLNRVLWLGVGVVLAHDIYYLLLGLSAPLLADHSYRQSQTAITAFWARRDGLKLAYETPVFGYPWAIPLEFPFYQWLVAALNLVGVPIDVAGRLLSFSFLVACAWPLALLRKALALPSYVSPLVLVLFFSAPIYVYWGRAVLIETCALFFALLWLALVIRAVQRPRLSLVSMAAIAVIGSLAMLQKATTFPVFGLMGGCFLLARFVESLRRSDLRDCLATLTFGAASCLVPLVVGLAWIRFSDDVKLLNPLAESLTSRAMSGWNYGTLAQRHSIELAVAIRRAVIDVFGYSAIFAALVMVYAVLVSSRYRLIIVIALIGFFAFFAIFTNLHIVHNYYQVANAVFLVAAVALAVAAVVDARHPLIALALLLCLVVGQNRFFGDRYLWSLRADLTQDDRYQIALRAKQVVRPDQALLVLGQDYSSVINYYSERKGIALTTALPRDLMESVLHDPSEFLGGMKVGAVAACRPFEFPYDENQALIDAYLSKRQVIATTGHCQLFAAAASAG